ncbi:hypothetical protein Clacol_002653 [Clathrus columnatus]|uniref:3-hydroxyacyl-CoA dehydrogenase n=1 Tax=Clathrus columnatus TaxID=1419009 RepID=A0AAV5A487_9AGAM|nr:hypothetical protein Clacol_002653 [Clathrus columnatus]
MSPVDDNQIETTLYYSSYPNPELESVTPDSSMVVDSRFEVHGVNEDSACILRSSGVVNCSGCIELELNHLMQNAINCKHVYTEILKNVEAAGYNGLNYQVDTLTWNDERLELLHAMTSAKPPLCYWTGYDQPVLVSARHIRPWTVLLPELPTTFIFPRRWINFRGHKSLPLWRSALCAVVSVLFLRPGMSLAELRRRLVSVYDRQELNDLLEFLLAKNFVEKVSPAMRNHQIRETGILEEEEVNLSLTYARRCSSAIMAILHGIKMLGVVGSGQMGLGIAYVSALRARVSVALTDKSEAQIVSGLAFFDKLLKRDIEKGRITAREAEEAKNRVQAVQDVKDLRDADMAVSENFSIKSTIFRRLAAEVRPDAILASNTSSIPITKIATSVVPEGMSASSPEGIKHTSRVVGNIESSLHNDAHLKRGPSNGMIEIWSFELRLVELIPAIQTSKETLERARAFAIACGKGEIYDDQYCKDSNVLGIYRTTRDDIDKTLKLGMNHPMGPLQLADFIGLDTCLFIQRTLYEGTSDSKYRPSVLLERMVDAGWLGKKSGKGFYDYS